MFEYRKAALKAADYMLDGDPGAVYVVQGGERGAGIVERKASIDELSDHVFNPQRRPSFIKLLTRMRECWRHPNLVIEGGLSTLSRPSRKVESGLIIDGLQRLSMEYGVPIQLVDGRGLTQRAFLGEYVVRWLMNSTVAGGFSSVVPPILKDTTEKPNGPIPD